MLACLLLFYPVQAQIVFSEVMFDVPGPDYDNEFVEFYNCSDSAVDLAGWQFSDSSGFDFISDAGQGTVLQAGQFAVLLDGSYFGRSSVYDTLIPPQALIVTISDNALGNSGLSNTKGERLSLINSDGKEVAVYRYSVDNEPGYSDEKINECGGDEASNWANSLRLWGTPGFKNSVTPADFDIGFRANGLQLKPQSAVKKGQTVFATLFFTNAGRKFFSDSLRFRVFADFNENGLVDALEPVLFERAIKVNLKPQAQDSLHFTFRADFSGALSIVAVLSSAKDQNPNNNRLQRTLMVIESTVALKINEIKFLTQKGEPEWVEIFNAGKETVNLRSWALTDGKDTARISTECPLRPEQFKVIAADSGLTDFYDLADSDLLVVHDFPTLNNEGDVLFLLAPWGDWTEQVAYRKTYLWGEAYRLPSLERINPLIEARLENNWGPSVAAQGATPGRRNSLYQPLKTSKLKLQIDPNPFSPDGDGVDDNTIITLRIPTNAARLRAVIYDVLGRKIVTLSTDRLTGQSGRLIWNGRDARNEYVRTGIYLVFVQIVDDRNGILQEAKATIDVAR